MVFYHYNTAWIHPRKEVTIGSNEYRIIKYFDLNPRPSSTATQLSMDQNRLCHSSFEKEEHYIFHLNIKMNIVDSIFYCSLAP